ncbi:polysaccharide ABC transporter ATP-binding protein [Desulfobacterota bacterium AH_259_B03_O07]|nr:polysaccharide ABC transporter ATP-binding protein [Desulfobacterota bacterium AH_259_B03_O07]
MSDVVIRVEHISKQYRIGTRESYKALRDTLTDAIYAPFRRLSSAFSKLPSNRGQPQTTDGQYIWALKDISLEVKQGEVLGIIGPNGAGKTTLLKVLSRITDPTEGYAKIHGRVGSLLEVGTGFHPELTGRENIYLNGAILGMKRSEIERKFDEIIEFSGVEKFIDTPVKRYSSGMYVRLAFGVAAHLDPEILVVDEVLAVGDAAFRKKCLGKMGKVAEGGKTVLLVSHNMGAIKGLAHRVIWMDQGLIREMGEPDHMVDHYLREATTDQYDGVFDSSHMERNRARGNKFAGRLKLNSVTIKIPQGMINNNKLPENSSMILDCEVNAEQSVNYIEPIIRVKTVDGQTIFTTMPGRKKLQIKPGICHLSVGLNLGPLLPGSYRGDILLMSNVYEDSVHDAFFFDILPPAEKDFQSFLVAPNVQFDYSGLGIIRTKSYWIEFEKLLAENKPKLL